MKIKHIEKTTLVDYPGKIACTIFLFGCNFRCGFCYNSSLVLNEETKDINEEEIITFLKTRKEFLDGVCITGGEPLMSLTENFLKRIKSLGFKIKIDTNGSFPEKLREIINQKLVDYIAIDIKGAKNDYEKIIKIKFPIEKIEQSIKIISEFPEHEFRTTILQNIHTKEKFEEMLNWIYAILNKKMKRFSIQGFKNRGSFVDNNFSKEKNTPENYLNELKKIAEKFAEKVEIRY